MRLCDVCPARVFTDLSTTEKYSARLFATRFRDRVWGVVRVWVRVKVGAMVRVGVGLVRG